MRDLLRRHDACEEWRWCASRCGWRDTHCVKNPGLLLILDLFLVWWLFPSLSGSQTSSIYGNFASQVSQRRTLGSLLVVGRPILPQPITGIPNRDQRNYNYQDSVGCLGGLCPRQQLPSLGRPWLRGGCAWKEGASGRRATAPHRETLSWQAWVSERPPRRRRGNCWNMHKTMGLNFNWIPSRAFLLVIFGPQSVVELHFSAKAAQERSWLIRRLRINWSRGALMLFAWKSLLFLQKKKQMA
jgi:hypothetical protein